MSLRELNSLLEDQMQWVRQLGDPDELSPFIYEERLRSQRANLEERVRFSEQRTTGQRSSEQREMNARCRRRALQLLNRQRSQPLRRQRTLHHEQSERMMVLRRQIPIIGPSQHLPNPSAGPSQPIPSPRQSLSDVHFLHLPYQPCVICGADFETGEYVWVLLCRHLCHQHCLREWTEISLNCPLCRGPCF